MVGVQWPVQFIDAFEQILLPADDEKLLILSLKQADTDGEVDGHDPELNTTREGAVERVDDKDDDEVDMKDAY